MIWLWGLIGSFGGLTLLFPLAAAVLAGWLRGAPRLPPPGSPIELEVLIPAYNEAETILHTLESVLGACRALLAARPDSRLSITVALDGPTDSTPRLVSEFAARTRDGLTIRVLDRGANRGKWATLRELVEQSHLFWSALVDSGTLWPEDFLVRMADRLVKSDSVGLAPGYRHARGGSLARLVWFQERVLKSVENLSGGPLSLHGATMIFRSRELKEAIEGLNTRAWLNDDVVLGLALRQKGRIDYLGEEVCVEDCGVKDGQGELGRRKRLLLGNVEWIQILFLPALRHAPVVGLLALRRIMRVLWAYHLMFSAFCVGMLIGLGVSGSLALLALLTLVAASSRRLREAGAVSLAAPILILRKKTTVRWT